MGMEAGGGRREEVIEVEVGLKKHAGAGRSQVIVLACKQQSKT